MISANLKCLRLAHNKPDFSGLLMLQELDCAGASLFPLIPILIIPIKLRLAVEDGVFFFLAGSNCNLFKLNDRRNLSSGVLILRSDGFFLLPVLVLRLGAGHW
nr:hypothetical protein Iba_chr08cCG8730 [Ipomoea batatas]GMD28148.1 hypothetical protein Iba_chr08eCG4590 [Ipomoea batatas]